MFFMGALTIPINFSEGRPSGALRHPTNFPKGALRAPSQTLPPFLWGGGTQRPFLGGGGLYCSVNLQIFVKNILCKQRTWKKNNYFQHRAIRTIFKELCLSVSPTKWKNVSHYNFCFHVKIEQFEFSIYR